MSGAELVRAEESRGLALADGPSALAGTLAVWKDAAELAASIANTQFVPKDLRNNPAAVTAAMLTGAELGLPPMASLAKIHVIEGRPGLSAEAMRALVLSHGHELWADDEKYTSTQVKLYGRRAGSDKVSGVLWTLDMAKAANLVSKDNWRKYPRAMLLARATGELCRLMFADVLGGISYTVEEIEDGFDDQAEADDGTTADKPKTQTRQATKKAAAKKQAAPAAPAAPRTEPPAPPLPGEDGFDDQPPAEDVESKQRAQQIGMRCQQAGLTDGDRHHLIAAVTNGRVASAKEVTAEEGSDVLLALREIAAGRKQLVEGDEGRWELVDVEDATDDNAETAPPEAPPQGVPAAAATLEEETWGAEEWRAYLRPRQIKVSDVLRKAQQLAGELHVDPPTTLDQLKGNRNLASLVRGYVEDLAEQKGYQP